MNPLAFTLLEGALPGLMVVGALAVCLPWLDRNTQFRAIPILLTVLLTIRYISWRLLDTIPPVDETANFVAGVLFAGVELASVAGTLLSFVTLSRTRNRSPEASANAAWVNRQTPTPLIDVFICTYNEGRELLERTIIGALSMDYPAYRVWVLDDGHRHWLRQLSESLGCHYLSRPDNADAKAGNINFGLAHVARLQRPPDFVAILDADFVPTEGFLKRTLALFRDPDVGIVQTPQHFINPDPIQNNLAAIDAIPDEQRYFFDVLMPAKDAWDTAFCCGTSSLIRMRAVQRIGGIPTDSVTEDYLTTLRMKRAGYRTVYLNERLSLGLAPEGLKEYVTQRSRWCMGFMQIVRGGDGPFAGGNGLALTDRLALIETFLYWTASYAFRLACLLVPVLYLMFDIRAVDVDIADGVSHFLPYYFAHIAVIAWLSERRVLPVIADLSALLAAREVLTAAFIGLVWPKGRKFHVTAKGGDRSKQFVQWRMARMFALFLAATLGGIAISFIFDPNRPLQDSAIVALYWSWYNIAVLIAAIGVCVERPRYRTGERLAATGAVWLGVGESWQGYTMVDISVTGIRVKGTPPAPVGTKIDVQIGQARIKGRIARQLTGEFAVAVEDSLAARAAMVPLVHSGRFGSQVGRTTVGAVAQRVLARMFG
jgi:cellulose synthase (UDP-forming)